MPWISKDQLDALHIQIGTLQDSLEYAASVATSWQAEALAAQKEVRALNKAVKNKHKLKTALREATKMNQELLKMAKDNLDLLVNPIEIASLGMVG